jgi:hypothetical protein
MIDDEGRARVRLGVARLSAALLAAFVVYNVTHAFAIQDDLLPEERLAFSPDGLEEAALGNRSSAWARGRYGIFYHIANRIAGARVIMPRQMQPYLWEWRNVAHIDVRFAQIPSYVAEGNLRQLRQAMPSGLHWLERDKSAENHYRISRDFYLLSRGAAQDYVLAESRARELFLIPVDLYEEIAEPEISAYFRVARSIAGATVTLPPTMDLVAPEWERAAQVEVWLGEAPRIIPQQALRKLRRRVPPGIRWLRPDLGTELEMVDFYLAVDAASREYVLTESPDGRELFLLPANDPTSRLTEEPVP